MAHSVTTTANEHNPPTVLRYCIYMRYLLFALTLTACQTLPTTQHVFEGDSTKRLRALYGEPSYNLPSVRYTGARAWYYLQGKEICGYTVKDEAIVFKAPCGPFTPQMARVLEKLSRTEMLPKYRSVIYGGS